MQFLKVTFHLQLLQNIGCICHIVQYILKPGLHPIAGASCSPIPILPSNSPLLWKTTSLLSTPASLLLFFLQIFRLHM